MVTWKNFKKDGTNQLKSSPLILTVNLPTALYEFSKGSCKGIIWINDVI